MSSTDGDASSRLDEALSKVLDGSPTLPPRETSKPAAPPVSPASPTPSRPPTADDWDVDDHEDDFEMPEIVPATPPEPAPRPAASPAPSAPATPPTSRSAPPSSQSAPPPTTPTTSWSDHMNDPVAGAPVAAAGAPLRAPGRRPRVRRVTRVVRHIDPWSTFKVALLFSFVAYLVALTSGVLLWRVADATGTLDNIERWFTQFGWETFELKGDEIFRNAWIIGLFAAVALTGTIVLLATLFNLVSDIVGGVRMTVLEEEVVERTISSTRRYVVRRTPAAATADDDWSIDDGGDDAEPDDAAQDRSDAAAAADDWSVDDDEPDDDDANEPSVAG